MQGLCAVAARVTVTSPDPGWTRSAGDTTHPAQLRAPLAVLPSETRQAEEAVSRSAGAQPLLRTERALCLKRRVPPTPASGEAGGAQPRERRAGDSCSGSARAGGGRFGSEAFASVCLQICGFGNVTFVDGPHCRRSPRTRYPSLLRTHGPETQKVLPGVSRHQRLARPTRRPGRWEDAAVWPPALASAGPSSPRHPPAAHLEGAGWGGPEGWGMGGERSYISDLATHSKHISNFPGPDI